MDTTLLAIDDDPRSLELTRASLEQDGLEILTATDPVAALEIVRARLPVSAGISVSLRPAICSTIEPDSNSVRSSS